ncbi:hypothetical protein K0A97_00465 [Patescibacteria group bacterium]|nr:hypothetical protein [Patescibacteria group bacterium]
MNSQNFTPLRILNSKEKKRIEKELEEQFGIQKIPGILVQRGKERLFLFSGNLDEKEIKEIESEVIVERLGIYFAKFIEEGIKLSIEGAQILKEQIRKNIFELPEDMLEMWMKGQDLQISTGKKGFLIIKYKEDFLGCGKASNEKIGNFIPKSRRLKEKN